MRKVIISLAPVQAGTSVDAVKLAEDVEKSVKLGAAMCHLHCRKPDGSLTPDISYMSECFDEILKRTDVVVQASTGGVSDMNIQERCNPLDYPKVESASLNGGSTNLGEAVYVNSFDDIRYCADAVYKRGILPETEVFDIGISRAVAKLNVLCELTLPFIKKEGLMVALKGVKADEELIEAENAIKKLGGSLFDKHSFNLPSNSGERTIILIKKLLRTSNYKLL